MSTPGPGQLLFAFVRQWSRRGAIERAPIAEQGRLVLVTDAVAALTARDALATVNAVAHELGLDQSGASRLIAGAVDAGYLEPTRGSRDARRREVSVSAAGRAALRSARAWQESVFAELTADWSQQRRDDFRGMMAELVARSRAIDGQTARELASEHAG